MMAPLFQKELSMEKELELLFRIKDKKKSVHSDVSLCCKCDVLQKKLYRQSREGIIDIWVQMDASAQAKESS